MGLASVDMRVTTFNKGMKSNTDYAWNKESYTDVGTSDLDIVVSGYALSFGVHMYFMVSISYLLRKVD